MPAPSAEMETGFPSPHSKKATGSTLNQIKGLSMLGLHVLPVREWDFFGFFGTVQRYTCLGRLEKQNCSEVSV